MILIKRFYIERKLKGKEGLIQNILDAVAGGV